MADLHRLTPEDLAKFQSLVHEPPSAIKAAQEQYEEYTTLLLEKLKRHAETPKAEAFIESTFVSRFVTDNDCVFVGHVNTDLDSIAGAIGAAALFGGVAARAEEDYNGEIVAGLKFAGLDPPEVFDKVPGVKNRHVFLIDHNEVKQMTPSLRKDPKRMERIVGLIDHHAVAESFVSSKPLYIEVQPWGSMSTIIAHLFIRNNKQIPKSIARILLCAILSDTLNLRSGTTTKTDKFCVALLAKLGEVDDVDGLANQTLFQAKTAWIVGLGAYEMVRGDQKDFSVGKVRFSISVLEVTDIGPVLAVAEDILIQLHVLKTEKGKLEDGGHDVDKELHAACLFVIDVLKQQSVMLVCGSRELWIAKNAFPAATPEKASPKVRSPSQYMKADETLFRLPPGLVSRKLEFLPMTSKALNDAITAGTLPEWYCTVGCSAKIQKPTLLTARDSVKVDWDVHRKQLMKDVFTAPTSPKALRKPKFSKVSALSPNSDSGINLLVRVSGEPHEVEGDRTELVVGDTSGVITMTLSSSEKDKEILTRIAKKGTLPLRIQNAQLKMVRGHMRLSVGKLGVCKLHTDDPTMDESEFGEPNAANDVSATEYELEGGASKSTESKSGKGKGKVRKRPAGEIGPSNWTGWRARHARKQNNTTQT
mmetsp:Transcript_68416/g.135184  ORF Transcript_68416/g.135184 Transcript_68416/m.135184 type:complete len:647 (-) Transcript_68416:240-2180(-)